VPKSYQCECLHCKELFEPEVRNRWHQKYCGKLPCRSASKSESQRRWLSKPQNRDHFRGSENTERVRQWRKANPGYWKRTKRSQCTLQDFLDMQGPLLAGLISQLIDSPLQDHIEEAARSLLATKGSDHIVDIYTLSCIILTA